MPPVDKKEEESGILVNKEHTNNKTALMYKIIFLLIILGLLVIGYLLAIKTNLDENLSDLELIEQQTESPIDLELQNQEPSSEEKGLTNSIFPVGYNGFIISGPEVDVNPNDYKILHQESINRQFWAKPYFIADSQVYYAKPNASVVTSRLLKGVDASSFKMVFAIPNIYPYAKDKSGVICEDRRADHIDKDTLSLVGNQGYITGHTTYLRDKYVRDKNNIIFNCLILNGIDTDTFTVIKDNVVQDKNGIYYADTSNGAIGKIENININSYEILSDGYIVDATQVFYGTSSVGKVIKKIPSDFSGKLFLKDIENRNQFSRILLQHDTGEVDMLAEVSVNRNWSFNYNKKQFFIYNEKVFFIDDNNILNALDTSGMNGADTYLEKINEITEINDLYLHNDVLYYLKGENCNEYLSRCDLGLYSYNLLNKVERLFTNGVKARYIIGYDEDFNKLYLGYSDGDAGCFFTSYYEYDFNLATLNEIGEKSGCNGEVNIIPPPFKEILPIIEEIKNDTLVEEVIFRDGKILR